MFKQDILNKKLDYELSLKANSTVKVSELTNRQNEILVLLSKGNSNKEIARHLNISEHTIRAHLSNMYRILKVNNRLKAIIVYQSIIKGAGLNS